MAGKESARRTRRAISAVSGLMAVLALLALYFLETRGAAEPAPTPASGKALQEKAAVYFLDVGQGDSILIRAGDYAMLIDAGVRGAGDAIEADLEALGVDALDAVVATHPHADHIGAMDQILEDYEVGTFTCRCCRMTRRRRRRPTSACSTFCSKSRCRWSASRPAWRSPRRQT